MGALAHAAFHDLAPAEESFVDAVLGGLSRARKSIPCRFLYDARGSELFEAICETPEYYLTRTETQLLEDKAPEIAARVGPKAQLIEFGSGSSRKVRTLLRALDRPAAYLAIDISREPLREATESIAEAFPGISVVGVCADYTRPFKLPELPARGRGQRVGFFPGSTIGNFTPDEALQFLSDWRRVLGRGGSMLIGVDLKKDKAVLDAAYDDAQGVTRQFSLNLLARINRELGADFQIDRFAHDAAYNPSAGRVEIHIRSLADQIVTVAGRAIHFTRNERIHTEYSYKYAIDEFQALARRAGFRAATSWTDRDGLFSVHHLG